VTSRSIRNKLRWQAEKIESNLLKAQGHLQFIDDLAEGKSNYIDDNLPVLTIFLEEMIKTIRAFRQGL